MDASETLVTMLFMMGTAIVVLVLGLGAWVALVNVLDHLSARVRKRRSES